MNTKRKTVERSIGNRLISMFLLLFISIVGLYISGNMICYIGIGYASIKTILILRPTLKKIFKENKLSWKFKLTGVGLFFCFIMLFIGIYMIKDTQPDYVKVYLAPHSNSFWKTKNIMIIQNHPIILFVVAVFVVIIGLMILMLTRFKNEIMIIQNIIEKKIKEMLYGMDSKI